MNDPIIISAGAGTDAWKKPPSEDIFNVSSACHTKNHITNFVYASATFTSTYGMQYDQVGIMLTMINQKTGNRKWIKTGIEIHNGHARLSTVCCDNYSDWSVSPMAKDVESRVLSGSQSVTILIETQPSPTGDFLWIYHVDNEGKQYLREVCWPFGEPAGEDWELDISAFVARPAEDARQLEARFHAFNVEWK